MAALLVVATIIGVFFVVGLVVGGIVVIALPVLRSRRSGRWPDGNPPHHGDGQDAGREEGLPPDDRPRWPTGADNDYPGR